MSWRRLSWIAAAALAGATAEAHPSPLSPERPALSADDVRRIETLADRAIAEQQLQRPGHPPFFAGELTALGLCARVEPLLRGATAPALLSAAQGAAGFPDRACADRLIAMAAEAAAGPGAAEIDPYTLYLAGALWRRIGEEDKGQEAIERAERHYAALEADPGWGWSCHGGNCLSPAWATRLAALQMYHGSRLYPAELRWLVFRALSLDAARDARRQGPYVGQRVFEELTRSAAEEGAAVLGQLAAVETVYGRKTYSAQRMHLLLRQGRTAEALALWPAAEGSFHATIGPFELRGDPAGFHAHRARFREWRVGNPAEPLSWLPLIWLERGDTARAREALAAAREDLARGELTRFDWAAAPKGRADAAGALLDGGADPVGRLTADTNGLDRDFAMVELAGALAAAGRWDQVRRAIAAIANTQLRRRVYVQLPCRAAAGGDRAARMAIRLARGHLRPEGSRDERITFGGTHYQTFLCLFRFRLGEAALAYVLATDDADARLGSLAEMPLGSGVANGPALRRRFAEAALARIETGRLWDDNRVPYIAADFERLGDFARVDRVLLRAQGETRLLVYQRLLDSYTKPRS